MADDSIPDAAEESGSVTEDIGGVQGSPDAATSGTNDEIKVPHLASPAPEQLDVGGGEIEWTELAKEPPAPEN